MEANAELVKTLSWQAPPADGCARDAVGITSTVDAAP